MANPNARSRRRGWSWVVMGISPWTRRQARIEARIRNINIGEYLTRLVELHEVVVSIPDERLQEELRILDLERLRTEPWM